MIKRDNRIYVRIRNRHHDYWYEVLIDESLAQCKARYLGYYVTEITKKEALPYLSADELAEQGYEYDD